MKHPHADFQQFMKARADMALACVNGDAARLGDILATQAPAMWICASRKSSSARKAAGS